MLGQNLNDITHCIVFAQPLVILDAQKSHSFMTGATVQLVDASNGCKVNVFEAAGET